MPLLPAIDDAEQLQLLTAAGWQSLGKATLVAPRRHNALAFTGVLRLPADLQNRWLWMAHGGHIYRLTYLSHIGNAGTITVHLKVDRTMTPAAWAALPLSSQELAAPTAAHLRQRRFGERYADDLSMFAGSE